MSRYDKSDVVIAGAGVAGLAAGCLLARAGLRVICVDPQPPPRARVGESLDWSAPGLLSGLGLDHEALVESGVGTFKREVRAITPAGELMVGRPPAWLGRRPLRFETATLHVDRDRFDRLLYEVALDAGVEFIRDRIDALVFDRDRITESRTGDGRRLESDWFVDATGRRRLLARSQALEGAAGRPRISLWASCRLPMAFEGTMLYLDDRGDELSWAWEIPIRVDRLSIGVVMALNRFRSSRRSGMTLGEILAGELEPHPRFRDLSPAALGPVRSRHYRTFTPSRVAGQNWIMVGEAAAFVDPLTANGVTAAMRHASEAAALIVEAPVSPAARKAGLRAFDRRVREVAELYNAGIESLLYEPLVRSRLGVRWASRAYIPLGYFTNSLYTRLEPTTRPRMLALIALVRGFRMWIRAWRGLARLLPGASPTG